MKARRCAQPYRGWWPAVHSTALDGNKTNRSGQTNVGRTTEVPPPLWLHHKLLAGDPPNVRHLQRSPSKTDSACIVKADPSDPPTPLYAGIFLSGPSRRRLLAHVPPRHARVLACDIPLVYDPSLQACCKMPLGSEVAMGVSDCLMDDKAQVVCVTLPAWLRFVRARLNPPHVTVSLVDGVDEKYAVGLIIPIKFASEDQDGLTKTVPVPNNARVLHGVLGVRLSNGSIVYTANELRATSSRSEAGEGQAGGLREGAGNYPMAEQAEKSIDLASLVQYCLPRVDLKTRAPNNGPILNQVSSSGADITHAALMAYKGNTAATGEFLAALWSNHLADLGSSGDAPEYTVAVDSSGGTSRNRVLELLTYLPRLVKARGRGNSRQGRKAKRWWHEALDNWEPSRDTFALGAAIMTHYFSRDGEGTDMLRSMRSQHEVAISPLRKMFLKQEGIKRAEMHAHKSACQAALMGKEAAKARGHSESIRLHAWAASQHAAAANSARQFSSFAAFGANNSLILNIFKLDLHGIHLREALIVLSHYIDHLEALGHPGGVLLNVVTGVGRHSPDGAVLLPAVLNYLSNNRHLFDIDETNPGVVKVFIEPPIPFQETTK